MLPTAQRCDRCRGSGRVASVRCRQCRGIGTAVAWGDLLLTWSFAVDHVAVRGRRTIAWGRAIVTVVLLVVALWFLIAVFLFSFPSRVPYASPASQLPSTFTVVPFVSPLFGFSLLLTLAAISQLVRQRERDAPTTPRIATPPNAPLTMPTGNPATIPAVQRCDIVSSFHPDARATIERAATIAERLHHPTVLSIHLFAAVLASADGATLFGRLGVDSDGLKDRIRNALGRVTPFAQVVTLDPATVDTLAAAYAHAARARRPSIHTLDLLLSLSAGEGIVREILDDLAVPHAHVVNVAAWVRVREDLRARYRRYHTRGAFRPKGGMNRAMTAIATPILDAFGEDLTALAAAGAFGPTVDRDREFREFLRILESGRRGIVLVGEAGVGKSAIIEGLAERMAGEDVPAALRDKRLVRLSVAALTSGVAPAIAQERLLVALHEAARSGNIVLVVESLEHLVGVASGGAAAIDLGDVLATALERGGILLIGATTPAAYRQFIERSSLGGLLERIPVEEPEGDDAIQIIEARSILVEAQQRVFFSYGAIAACVELSDRYLHDRVLPEKAVGLMEQVATMVRMSRGERQIVTREDVARVIEEKTGIPATEITAREAEKLLHLEERMHERIIGQDEAVQMIAAALRRARVSLREGKRPIATFLFLGPTGVGKTELAKTVAATYFGAEDAMVRLDMSEYQDAASVHRLIGAPPGYAGAEAGGQLTEAVRRNPYSLVLLDELEKAHPDILNLFLQVFDDGRLTDSAGRTVDCTNAIIIATSNAGTPYIQDAVRRGESVETMRRVLLETELRGVFRPEFLNRFDGVIVFTPLTLEQIERIARLLLAKVAQQLEAKGIHFRATDTAVRELAEAGFDPMFGARPLRRVIQERVQDALATFLLTQKLGRRDTAVLDAGGRITIEEAREL